MRIPDRLVCAVVCMLVAPLWTGGRLRAQATTAQDHPGQYSAMDVETGSRLYAGQCALCHGTNGDVVAGVDLRRGQFRRAVSDEDIARVIVTGIPAAGMPAFKFQPSEVDGLVAFIRAGFDVSGTAVKVGDPARGQALFAGKGRCGTCHRVNGTGPRVAPDLSDVGAIRTPAALQRSLLDPTTAMLPINRPVRAVTRDGRTIQGRRLNEDTFTVQLIDDQERLVSLQKADLREYQLAATSPMPSMAKTLTTDEIADLVAYLLSLKGL
jgi:putative heme-binding domain-containing protein